MKKQKLAKNEYIDDKGHLKKKGFLAWLKNYGYYYSSYAIVGAVMIGFLVALYFSMQTVRPDMKLFFCVNNELEDATFQTFCDNVYGYLIDIDGDDVQYLEPNELILKDDPQTTTERSAYNTLEKALEDQDVVFFVTDEYGYDYLMSQDALRDLAFFGINSPDVYRLRLNDTALWNGISDDTSYYLVMKYIPDEKYEDFYISTITTMVVDMCYDLVGEPEV